MKSWKADFRVLECAVGSVNRRDADMDTNEKLDDLLDAYEEAIERGEQPDIDAMCHSTPEIAGEFRKRIQALSQVNGYFDNPSVTAESSNQDTLRISTELTELSFHDKGGLGAVYRATEAGVHRQVAVKFIHRNLTTDPDSRARFELEAEVTGRLEHPGIVPLYGLGEAENGRLFYYMRFIEGEKLDDAIRDFHQKRPSRGHFAEQSVEFRRILACFVSVCKTVAYAHNRGIVHRDIKPANVMIGKFGETLVVDWGLAVPVTRDQRFVVSGEATLRPKSPGNSGGSTGTGIGTAAYMSPEQASELAPAPASDIYSLGATLYKILTGEPSVSGAQVTELKEQIITGRIIPPRNRLPSVPAPLEAICLKAMALHPRDRYATALDLAADVENYLADSDISAYDEPLNRKIARLARKHRIAAQATVMSLIFVVGVCAIAAGWSALMANSEKEARREANLQRQQAIEARELAESARKQNLISSASFLAESIAHQIDKRWRIMESGRSSPQLIEYLSALNADTEDKESQTKLQDWLEECRKSRDVFRKQNSIWVIFDQKGTLVARDPKSRVIGNRFSYRDYFHGYGHDLVEGDAVLNGLSLDDLRPHQFLLGKLEDHESLHSAHLSDVFLSTATSHLQVTFSVPIWDRPAENLDKVAIGVFAISLEIQNLLLPDNAMMVQMRPDQLTGAAGLVISHPQLRPHTDTDLPPRVSGFVEAAQQIKQMRLREKNLGIRSSDASIEPFLPAYIDPVIEANTGEQVKRLAAYEPVIIPSRPDPIADTGWLIIVTETQNQSARAEQHPVRASTD
ncbi:MAG: serine/threonine protein kinase [Planctomycetales bacterium]|nr:serine/threonine protein kinase [Planctomycetales bacterium]